MILTVNVSYDWGDTTTENFHFLEGLFDFLDDTDSTATLFVLGNVAEKLAEFELSSRVEIASYCMEEKPLAGQSEDTVLETLKSSKAMLETMFKRPVTGFRVPFFEPANNTWEIAKMLGYTYSSSLLSSRIFKKPKVPKKPFVRDGIIEVPLPRAPTPSRLSFLRFFPLAKFLKTSIFYYSTTELIAKAPGDEIKSEWKKFLTGFRRGRSARKLLYDFLYKNKPTLSLENYLKRIKKSQLQDWTELNPPKKE